MATRRPAVPRTPAPKRAAPPAPRPGTADAGNGTGGSDSKRTGSTPVKAGQQAGQKNSQETSQKNGRGSGTTRLGRRKAAGSAPGSKTPLRTPVPTDEAPVPARAFSGRIVALAVVLVAITIMLAPTVRVFLGQRAEIGALQADITAKQAEQESLKQSIARWEDPNYVKQQARDRINMVMPGETAYWVFGDLGPTSPSAGAGAGRGTPGAGTSAPSATSVDAAGVRPWAQGFWDSLVRAATD